MVPYEQAGQMMADRKRVVDAVAEAIYIADEEIPEPDWVTLPKFGKTHYRKMAQAAIETVRQRDTGDKHAGRRSGNDA